MLLLQSIGLLHSHIDHLLGLHKLSLTPDGHGISTVGLPEHASDLVQEPCLGCFTLPLFSEFADELETLLLKRLRDYILDRVGEADVPSGVVTPCQEDVPQV